MKYAVDRIEEGIVVLESLEDGVKKEVFVTELPDNIKEGSILIYENNTFKQDETTEKKRRSSLRDRFNKLRKRKVDNS